MLKAVSSIIVIILMTNVSLGLQETNFRKGKGKNFNFFCFSASTKLIISTSQNDVNDRIFLDLNLSRLNYLELNANNYVSMIIDNANPSHLYIFQFFLFSMQYDNAKPNHFFKKSNYFFSFFSLQCCMITQKMKLLFQFFLSSMSSILKTVPAEARHLVQQGNHNFKFIFFKN